MTYIAEVVSPHLDLAQCMSLQNIKENIIK